MDYGMEMTTDKAAAICAAILENAASESDARRLQQKLMSLPGFEEEDISTVREISGDETNHAIKYEAMFKKYSGIVAAPDGMGEAISILFGKRRE